MKVYEFGADTAPVILLLPGTCCHWKSNFGQVIPLLQWIFAYFASAMMALTKQKVPNFRQCLQKPKKSKPTS